MSDIAEELDDSIPPELQNPITCANNAVAEQLDETEKEYDAREIPLIPSSALLNTLATLWTYPIDGMEAYRDVLKAAAADDALASHADSFSNLLMHLAEYDKPRETIIGAAALQLDYTRLFIGSFKMYAPPYASFYLDDDHLMYGPTAVEIERVYAQFGIELDKDQHDLPDHIRFLLAFMAMLADGFEKSGKRDYALACEDFNAEYLTPWLGQFKENIDTYAEYPYFKALIDFTISVL